MLWFNIVLVAIGSGVGGGCRYLMTHFYQHLGYGAKFHLATFSVNLIGSLLIGVLFHYVSKGALGERYNLLLLTGFMGGFTTFSSFSLDNLRLLQQGQVLTAFLYALSSLLAGLLLVAVGFYLAKMLSH